ncbi:hypothetical protein WJX74_001237 [Apatococcus lobatus]|uniref:Uncharacterized protein n=1 Tax=Apatococcus lobatus TaxID=904363 RepID=A0AAW1RY46_9CHLO
MTGSLRLVYERIEAKQHWRQRSCRMLLHICSDDSSDEAPDSANPAANTRGQNLQLPIKGLTTAWSYGTPPAWIEDTA